MNLKLIGIGASSFFLSQQIIMIAIIHLNLRTSSTGFLCYTPQKYTWNPKNFLCICIMYTCFIQCSWSFCRFVQYSRRPPKRKNYVFQICVQYTSKHHWWPFKWYPSPSRSIRCSDLELLRCHALRPRGTPEAHWKKKHMETDVFCWVDVMVLQFLEKSPWKI